MCLSRDFDPFGDAMVKLAEEGMTMMVVTHETGFAKKLSHRVIFMNEGRIVEDCSKDEFFGNPAARAPRAQEFLSKVLPHRPRQGAILPRAHPSDARQQDRRPATG